MRRIHATDRVANMSERMTEGPVMTEGKKPWTPEDQRRVEQRMVDKDDHFGLPEEGTVERAMIRRRAQRALAREHQRRMAASSSVSSHTPPHSGHSSISTGFAGE